MADEKKELTTLQKRNRFRFGHYALKVGTYVAPLIPASAIIGVNWQEWFGNHGASIPTGFAFLLLSVLLSVCLILKKDEEVLKKFSPIFFATVIVAMLGVAFMALASIGDQIGKIFLWTALGLIASFSFDQVDKLFVKQRFEEYAKLVADYGLDKKANAKRLRQEQAEKEKLEKAEKEAKENENVEATD